MSHSSANELTRSELDLTMAAYTLKQLEMSRKLFPPPRQKIFSSKDADALLGPAYDLRRRNEQGREKITSTWIDNEEDEDYVPEEAGTKRRRSKIRASHRIRFSKGQRISPGSLHPDEVTGAAEIQDQHISPDLDDDTENHRESDDANDEPDAWDQYWAVNNDNAGHSRYNLRTRRPVGQATDMIYDLTGDATMDIEKTDDQPVMLEGCCSRSAI